MLNDVKKADHQTPACLAMEPIRLIKCHSERGAGLFGWKHILTN